MDRSKALASIFIFAGLAIANDLVVKAFWWVAEQIRDGDGISVSAVLNIVGIILAALGTYLLLKPSDRVRRVRELRAIADRMMMTRSEIGRLPNPGAITDDILGKVGSCFASLRQLAISTPALTDLDPMKKGGFSYRFLSAIAPLVRDGHIREARIQAVKYMNNQNIPIDWCWDLRSVLLWRSHRQTADAVPPLPND